MTCMPPEIRCSASLRMKLSASGPKASVSALSRPSDGSLYASNTRSSARRNAASGRFDSANAVAATAFAESNLPEAALRRALDLVFEAYKEPSEGRLKALTDAFGPDALSFMRNEAEHLISGGMHVMGGTPYEVVVLSSTSTAPDQTEIKTRETWTYDEVDAQNRRIRCVREESEQMYTLHRVAAGWLVQAVTLSGTTRRADC